MTRLPRLVAAGLAVAALALAGCGGDDEESSDTGAATAPATETTAETAGPQQAGPAPLSPGGTFQPNDLADCLLDAGVGAAVSLDGASIELHDAMSQVIVEQGNAEMLVYGSEEAAAEQEDRYRESFGDLSDVKRVRNVLVQFDPEVPEEVKALVDGCTDA